MSWKVFQFKKNIGFLFWYLTIFVGFFFLLTKNDDKRVVMFLDHISTYYILFQLGVGEGNQGSIHRIALCVPRWQMEGHPVPFWWGGGSQFIIQKAWPWIIVGNMFVEGHALYTIDLANLTKFFVPTQISQVFPVAVKSCWPIPFYIVFIHMPVSLCIIQWKWWLLYYNGLLSYFACYKQSHLPRS